MHASRTEGQDAQVHGCVIARQGNHIILLDAPDGADPTPQGARQRLWPLVAVSRVPACMRSPIGGCLPFRITTNDM